MYTKLIIELQQKTRFVSKAPDDLHAPLKSAARAMLNANQTFRHLVTVLYKDRLIEFLRVTGALIHQLVQIIRIPVWSLSRVFACSLFKFQNMIWRARGLLLERLLLMNGR